jgi:hypothetical protein
VGFRNILCALRFLSTLHASTYVEEKVKCPVGGEKFKYMGLASISEWGALPDGMPLGSGRFPTCRRARRQRVGHVPGFHATGSVKAGGLCGRAGIQALRSSGETPYYLAYKTAAFLVMPALLAFAFRKLGSQKP